MDEFAAARALPDGLAAAAVKAAAAAGRAARRPDPAEARRGPNIPRLAAATADIWMATASWHADHRRWEAAETLARLVGGLRPADADAWLVLALVHRRKGTAAARAAVDDFLQRAANALTVDSAASEGRSSPDSPDLRALLFALSADQPESTFPDMPRNPPETDDGDVEGELLARAHPYWREALAIAPVTAATGAALAGLAEAAGVWPAAAAFHRATALAGDAYERGRAFARLSDLLERRRTAPETAAAGPRVREYLRAAAAEVDAEGFAANPADPVRRGRLFSALAERLAAPESAREWLLLRSLMPRAMAARPYREPDDDGEWIRWTGWLASAAAWALPAPGALGEAGAEAYAAWRGGLLRAGGGEAWTSLLLELPLAKVQAATL